MHSSAFMTRRTQRETGFSFIDVMLALVVLTIGVLAVADLQVISSSGNKTSQGITTAASLGEATLEALNNPNTIPYANIVSVPATQVVGADGKTYTKTVTVTTDSPLTNTKTVTVTLTWTDGSKTNTVPMSTIIAQ
jgi:type IV pilus assembly protein PilV